MTTPAASTVTTEPPPTNPAPPAGVTVTPPPAPPQPVQWSEEDVRRIQREAEERVRAQLAEQQAEQQKRYDAMQAEVQMLMNEREQQRQTAEASAEAERQAAEAARQAELTAQQRLEEGQSALTSQVATLTEQLAQRDAMIERERQYNDLMSYRAQQIESHADQIMPEMRDFIVGNSREEIDASVNMVVAKTSEVLESVRQARVNQFIAQPGVAPSGNPPTAGPMEQLDGTMNLSAEDIRGMPMADYARFREQLRSQAVNAYKGGSGGMFG